MRTHGQKMFYTEQEFSKAEFEAIERAREQAILNKYGNFSLLGTGSLKMSHVYKVIAKSGSGSEETVALKIISGITQECNSSDLELSKNQLKVKLRSNELENSAESEIKLQYDGINRCPNIIPLDGTDLLDWICPDFNRVGVDYVLKMPLAYCLFNTIKDFQQTEDHTDKVIQLGIDICTALESLHAQEIYHRDIKPANIYFYHGNYCLGDFGIAIHKTSLKLFEIGTEAYCAPEQYYKAREMNPWLCRKYNHRVDIYSLGLVLYELSGKKSVCNFFDQRINGTLPELSIESEGLKRIIHTACQFDPDERYQNATIFKENLERLQQDKNYIPSQEIGTISNKTVTQSGYPQPTGDTCIGKERDPYDDEFDPIEIEEQTGTSIANNMWNVGLFWYEKSQEPASRFANLKIDKNIMPLTSSEREPSYNFPIKCHTKSTSEELPLAQVIANINNIGDMYLIGEGGSGKTTALYSIMQDTYKGQMYPTKYSEKITIPLFIELSKAPDICGKAYQEGHSTFIQRYIYLLIKSAQQKGEMLTEDKNAVREVFGNSNSYEQDDIVSTVNHLLKEDNGVQYLLLLDGLNEVSRKDLAFAESSATVVELIINEIRELREYSNVTVVITSRADEAVSFGADFPKYYLSGIDDTTIKQYLKDNNISSHDVMQNPRLLDTLRVPFFLKLYCSLIFKSEVSTPGEILYNFFNERTAMYSLRKRISTIHAEQTLTVSAHVYNRITEKMQWFILDFLISELGWYMEKNDLYTIDLETIQKIMVAVLTGTCETDICGKYGISMFRDYHNGNDGSINVKTYANQLLALISNNNGSVQEIIDYCVYSLGILYVNNQDYGFIHQHIRDFFASMKLITVMKMALYIAEDMSDKNAGLRCLTVLNDGFLNEKIAVFVGEILGEYLNTSILIDIKRQTAVPDEKRLLLTKVLSLYKGIFSKEESVGTAIVNLLTMFEKAHKNLDNLDLSKLDLSRCNFNGMSLKGSSLDGSLVTKQTFFPYGHTSEITCIKVSPCGQYFLTGDSAGIVKLWHLKTRKYIRTVLNLKHAINNIQYIGNGTELLVSTTLGVYIYESGNYALKTQYKMACYGLSVTDEKTILAHNILWTNLMKIDILENGSGKKYNLDCVQKNFNLNSIKFSPDGKYIVYADGWGDLVIYNTDSFSSAIPVFETTKTIKKYCCICFDSTGNYLAVADTRLIRIISFNKLLKQLTFPSKGKRFHRVENEQELYMQISVPDNTFVTTLKFINKDAFLTIGFSNKAMWLFNYKENRCYNVASLPSVIASIDILCENNICTAVIGDADANIFIMKLNNLKSIDRTKIFPIYNTGSRYIDSIKVLPGGLFVSARREGQAYYDSNLNKITADPSTGREQFSYKVFFHSKKLAALGKETGAVYIYSLPLSVDKTIQISNTHITYMEFSPDDKLLLVTLENASPKVVHMDSFDVFTLNTFHHKTDKAVFSADGKYIFCCNGNYIEKFSSETYERLYYVKKYQEPYHENTVDRTLNYFKENKYQYDPATDVICSPDIMYQQYSSKVTTVSCSPDFLYMAIAWDDGKVEIREMETLSCIAILESNTFVKSIAFTSNGEIMAVPFGKSSVKIYDVNTWHCISILHGAEEAYMKPLSNEGHTKLVTCICFDEKADSPDKKQVITASNDGTIKYWKPFSTNIIDHPVVKKHKYLLACKKAIKMLWEKFYILSGTFVGEDGTTINCNDISNCDKTIYYVPGLDIDGSTIRNLHPDSDLSEKDLYVLKLNGAITE